MERFSCSCVPLPALPQVTTVPSFLSAAKALLEEKVEATWCNLNSWHGSNQDGMKLQTGLDWHHIHPGVIILPTQTMHHYRGKSLKFTMTFLSNRLSSHDVSVKSSCWHIIQVTGLGHHEHLHRKGYHPKRWHPHRFWQQNCPTQIVLAVWNCQIEILFKYW